MMGKIKEVISFTFCFCLVVCQTIFSPILIVKCLQGQDDSTVEFDDQGLKVLFD